ncbi:MAG: Coenzyme F420 hydrogenase/dehydrogenase, beta subunit C-terminal domain [Oscillospiraceae bacterium]|nr:Coenzyme F420 hydrogenase/dehydrogenase, beta subunit C-terminal domain [Oscillospiraceae bacterium]
MIAERNLCTGCTACAAACPKGCITMVPDEDGFAYPVIDAGACISCGLCGKVCPIVSGVQTAEREPKAYAAYTKDEPLRMDSSSGGVFSEIAKEVLRQGGAVYGAAYGDEFAVSHVCAEKQEDLAKLRGAKYAQSELKGVFAEIRQKLDAGQEVLFSGTPCQVGGLKAFLRKNYENLLTVDFVCHSVPSPMAWKAYVTYRAEQDNGGQLPESINLRAKTTGWSRYRYSNLFKYKGGAEHTARSGESLYMKLFVGGCINRTSCENCRFKGYSRISDLTIGDFWGIWEIDPELDDDKGASVVLVQSPRGEKIFDMIRDRCVVKAVTLEEASAQNGAMLRSSPVSGRRAEAFAMIRAKDWEKCAALLAPKNPGLLARALRKLGIFR